MDFACSDDQVLGTFKFPAPLDRFSDSDTDAAPLHTSCVQLQPIHGACRAQRSACSLQPLTGTTNAEMLQPNKSDACGLQLLETGVGEVHENAWEPGLNCGSFMGNSEAYNVQAQVLIGNCWAVASRQSFAFLKQSLKSLTPVGYMRGTSLVTRYVSAHTCIPCKTIEVVVHRLTKSRWHPGEQHGEEQRPENVALQSASLQEMPVDGVNERDAALDTLVRTCLTNPALGHPKSELVGELSRLLAARCDIGDKYHNRKTATIIEHMGKRCAQAITAARLEATLPALGIRSDIGVIFDGVTIGGSASWSSGETLLPVGVNFIDSVSGDCRADMLDAPSHGGDYRGVATADLIQQTMNDHPAKLTRRVCQRIVAGIGVDGNLTAGGPESTHKSTKGAEILWQHWGIEGGEMITWDDFHRQDLCGSHATSASELATEFYQLTFDTQRLYGMGQGKVLARSVADSVGCEHKSTKAPGLRCALTA